MVSAGSLEPVTPEVLPGHGFPEVGVTVVDGSVVVGSVFVGSVADDSGAGLVPSGSLPALGSGLRGTVVVVGWSDWPGRPDGDAASSGAVEFWDAVMPVLVTSSLGDVSGWRGALL